MEQTTPAYLAIEESFVNMVMNRCPRLTYRLYFFASNAREFVTFAYSKGGFVCFCAVLQFQANASRQY